MRAPPVTTPPVKPPPWKARYIPVYFWVGGIAAGSWVTATLEDVAGGRDPAVIRAGRYTTLASCAAGAALLVLDLGRPERFLNMLRIVRGRSPMSLGSWALAGFCGVAGAAALLQGAEDGWLDAPRLAGWSHGRSGRALHLLGLPLALFVGSYTGTLLVATNVPAWAERRRTLPALFGASALASGAAAVGAVAETMDPSPSDAAMRRLARARAVPLAAELALSALERARVRKRGLPSERQEPDGLAEARRAAAIGGIAAPLLLSLPAGRSRRRRLLAAGLTLAGALALRLLVAGAGRRSAARAEDTWRYAAPDA